MSIHLNGTASEYSSHLLTLSPFLSCSDTICIIIRLLYKNTASWSDDRRPEADDQRAKLSAWGTLSSHVKICPRKLGSHATLGAFFSHSADAFRGHIYRVFYSVAGLQSRTQGYMSRLLTDTKVMRGGIDKGFESHRNKCQKLSIYYSIVIEVDGDDTI